MYFGHVAFVTVSRRRHIGGVVVLVLVCVVITAREDDEAVAVVVTYVSCTHRGAVSFDVDVDIAQRGVVCG